MTDRLKITFSAPALPASGALVLFCGDDLALPRIVADRFAELGAPIKKAAEAENFKGKPQTALTLLAPAGIEADRVILIGIGSQKEQAETDYVVLGGFVFGRLNGAKAATVLLEGPAGWRADPAAAADLALGMRLRGYSFDLYKTRKKPDEPETAAAVTIAVSDPAGARKLGKVSEAVADGVIMARDLVNEPPNVCLPRSSPSARSPWRSSASMSRFWTTRSLRRSGCGRCWASVRARLAAAASSSCAGTAPRTPRTARSRSSARAWCSTRAASRSSRPEGMEDMKGDMAGAAAVVGLMQALAARKAKANVIGAIGLVENMPDGNAQRPGDIVTSLSGQTIEIINTDAEGRLVLADVLWYVKDRFKPAFMIDLADPDGRYPCGARPGARGIVLQQRRIRPSGFRLRERPRARWSGGCRWDKPMTR
jgi:leucyl aminopeptidase